MLNGQTSFLRTSLGLYWFLNDPFHTFKNVLPFFRLCGFEPKTINKYREIQDHLTNVHFRDKIEANLPQSRPFLCPYYVENGQKPCNYLGKDKQALLRHISKHGILEKYMEEELLAINTNTTTTSGKSGSNSPEPEIRSTYTSSSSSNSNSKPVILDLKDQDHEIKQHLNSITSAGSTTTTSGKVNSPMKSRFSRQFSEQPSTSYSMTNSNPKMFKRSLSSNNSAAHPEKFVPKQKQILGTSLFTPVPSMDIVKCNSCHLQVARRFIKSHLLKCPGSGDLNVLTIKGKSLQAAAEEMEYQQMSGNELIRRSILEKTKSGPTTSGITSGKGGSNRSFLKTISGTTSVDTSGEVGSNRSIVETKSRTTSGITSGSATSGGNGTVEELVVEPSVINLNDSTSTEEEILEENNSIPNMIPPTNENNFSQFEEKKKNPFITSKKYLDRRRIKNREAASKSRKRKNDYIRLLELENKNIKAENEDLKKKIIRLEMEKETCSWGLNVLSEDLIAITEKEAFPELTPEVVAGMTIKNKKTTPPNPPFHEKNSYEIDLTKKNSVIDQSIIDKINSVNRDISKKVEAASTKKIHCVNPNTLIYQSHVLPNVANSMNKDFQ